MTKVTLEIKDNGDIMYDCFNHAGDHDVCTIISTLSNVLCEASFRAGRDPTCYNKGHVRVDIPGADEPTIEVFRTVQHVMEQVALQHPDHVNLY